MSQDIHAQYSNYQSIYQNIKNKNFSALQDSTLENNSHLLEKAIKDVNDKNIHASLLRYFIENNSSDKLIQLTIENIAFDTINDDINNKKNPDQKTLFLLLAEKSKIEIIQSLLKKEVSFLNEN